MTQALRVGVLLNGYQVPAWVHLMLSRVAQSAHAELAFVVLNAGTREPSGGARERRRLLGRALDVAQARFLERERGEPDAFRPMDLEPLTGHLPALPVQPLRDGRYDEFAAADLARISACEPDVLVQLGFRELRGGILSVAKHGVWSYEHGDPRVQRSGPPGFRETMEGLPETGTVLRMLADGEQGGGMILYQSWSLTNWRSVTLNNNARYWTSASFLPRMLDRLGSLGPAAFFAEAAQRNDQRPCTARRSYLPAGDGERSVLLARKLVEKVRRRLRRGVWFEQWCLLFAAEPDLVISLGQFRRVLPPKDRFWADPNVLYRDGRWFVFLEECPHSTEKGYLSVLTVGADERLGEPVKIIEEDHHLSYPFVFEHAGELYMLAEAYDARVVPLYRCTGFPYQWVFERNLLENVGAVDPTLLCHRGTWYLFVGLAENPGSSPLDELFLYYADDPLSTRWTPHPMNPVVSDVKSARPAGRIFEHNGRLFRPGQNCSHRYGYGISVNEIEVLSETGYRERQVSTIEPDGTPGIGGVHTLSYAHGLTVADASVWRPRYW